VAGRYRALLIGNSTYPADEHNLQALKGPVKDIAAVNRALIDPQTGLFADVDVALLPEATSSRVIRTMGRFFGTADREDVLLVYFSGHGKLDQNGRLHLCMQDTESNDLLSTAVSSARINEFADASRARNVIIVLDCCHAGAFRGGELGNAVAGPGRYVLTSCRGTQLANDATVENGTSFFTQHLVDGLLGAAADQDQDGWVTFSDLYAYVNQRLREAGKQIPQQRISGDGDVRLARASPTAPVTPDASPAAGAGAVPRSLPEPSPRDTAEAPADSAPVPTGPPGTGGRRKVLLAAGAAVVIATGSATAAVLLTGGSGGHSPGSAAAGSHAASGPWRLKIQDVSSGSDLGCSVTLTDAQSGQTVLSLSDLYSKNISYQISQAGSFRWQVSNPHNCIVTPLDGPGDATLPLTWLQGGDTDAFATSSARVTVKVTDYRGSPSCEITLRDPANGLPIDSKTTTPGQQNDTVTLDAGGRSAAYLSDLTCNVRVADAP
jgi:Caspase domain